MDCKNVQETFIDLIENRLNTQTQETVLKHLEKCQECSNELENVKSSVGILTNELKRDYLEVPSGFKSSLMGRINSSARKSPKKNSRVFKKSSIAVACLIATFIIAINSSFAFTYYANKIPGISTLVSLGLIDKGVISAMEGDFGQKIDKSVSKDDVKFTVDEAITSENRTVLLCTAEWFGNIEGVPYISQIKVKNGDKDIPINGGTSWNYDENTKTSTGLIELQPINSDISKLNLQIPSVNLPNGKVVYGNWELSLFIDKEKAKEKQTKYAVDKSIKTDNGLVKITSVINSPGETQINFVAQGDAKGLGVIKLLDKNGKESKVISKSISGNQGSVTFDVSYPNKPKKIIISSVTEESSIGTPIELNINDSYPKTVKLEGFNLDIKFVKLSNDTLEVSIPVMNPPIDKIIKASLVDNLSSKVEWTLSNLDSTKGYEKSLNNDRAEFEQILSFKNVNKNVDSFKLNLDSVILYKSLEDETVLLD